MVIAKTKHFIIPLFFLLFASVQAAEIRFEASVDRSTVGLGEDFVLNVTVNSEDMANVPKPELPALPDFNLLGSSSSQSTNIQFVNGTMTKQSSINYVYSLSVKKLGKLTIGPCLLKYNDQEYKSQPIEIEAVKSSTTQAQTQNQERTQVPSGNVPVEGNLFLSASANKKSVYVGEQLTVDFTLYNRLHLANINLAETPAFKGFWSEKIFDAEKLNWKQKTLDGKAYNYMLLKSTALFPMSSGDLEISPMTLNVSVVQASRDFFGFFGSTQDIKVESKPIKIVVIPLPEGKPREFTGGVGNFALQAFLDKQSTTGSEPINLTVRVTGKGNIRLIEKPVVANVPGLKIMDPAVKEDVQVVGNVVKGSKTFNFPIIPQADGKYAIPAIKMAYFDPSDDSYHTLESTSFECTASGCSPSAPLVEATGLKILGTDINYIKPNVGVLFKGLFSPPHWILIIYLICPFMIFFSFWYRSHINKLSSDLGYARRHRSSNLVKKRLSLSQKYLKIGDRQNFYAALSQTVMGFVGDRYNLDAGALTREQLKVKLMEKQLPENIISEISELTEYCDQARFSASTSDDNDTAQMLERARKVLNQL